MRKSIINIIILAICIINIVLSGILVFAIVPAMTSTNKMVTSICKLIDLELEVKELAENDGRIPIEQIETYDIVDEFMINLKEGTDKKQHYVMAKVTLSIHKQHEDYEVYGTSVASQESLIRNKIIEVFSSYTLEEARGYTNVVREKILEELQEMYQSDFIIDVTFRELTFS